MKKMSYDMFKTLVESHDLRSRKEIVKNWEVIKIRKEDYKIIRGIQKQNGYSSVMKTVSAILRALAMYHCDMTMDEIIERAKKERIVNAGANSEPKTHEQIMKDLEGVFIE